jgi:hypothetical protein
MVKDIWNQNSMRGLADDLPPFDPLLKLNMCISF